MITPFFNGLVASAHFNQRICIHGFNRQGIHRNGTYHDDLGFNVNGMHHNGSGFDNNGFC